MVQTSRRGKRMDKKSCVLVYMSVRKWKIRNQDINLDNEYRFHLEADSDSGKNILHVERIENGIPEVFLGEY